MRCAACAPPPAGGASGAPSHQRSAASSHEQQISGGGGCCAKPRGYTLSSAVQSSLLGEYTASRGRQKAHCCLPRSMLVLYDTKATTSGPLRTAPWYLSSLSNRQADSLHWQPFLQQGAPSVHTEQHQYACISMLAPSVPHTHRCSWLLPTVELEGQVCQEVHQHSKRNHICNTCSTQRHTQ